MQGRESSEPTSNSSSIPYDRLINAHDGHNIDSDGQTRIGIEIKERFNDMRTAFLNLDLNFDGRLTRDELLVACRKWNIPVSEAQRVINCADVDENGYLDFDEFAKRFDPTGSMTADDEEIVRLYQQGVMANESPIKLSGVYHGTSTTEPLVDEAALLRTDNADLRGRLARCMRKVADLEATLNETHAHNVALDKSLRESQACGLDLKAQIHVLEEARQRDKENERIALERAEEAERQLRKYKAEEDNRRYHDRLNDLEDIERRRREQSRDIDDMRRHRDLEEALRKQNEAKGPRSAMALDCDDSAIPAKDESKIVFVYGRAGCEKTDAMHTALRKAKIPFEARDFDRDKRFVDIMKQSGHVDSSVYAPVVCLGNKAWWYDSDATHVVPFPQEVAAELRRALGISTQMAPVKVRVDADIDSEIYERFLSMQDAFLKLDVDKNGVITEQELKDRCLEWNIPTSEAQRIIYEVGRDACGALDFDMFAKRFGGARHWGSRGVHRGQALAPHRQKVSSKTK
jgi:Ca2+-binding EF-hand superfamily protein